MKINFKKTITYAILAVFLLSSISAVLAAPVFNSKTQFKSPPSLTINIVDSATGKSIVAEASPTVSIYNNYDNEKSSKPIDSRLTNGKSVTYYSLWPNTQYKITASAHGYYTKSVPITYRGRNGVPELRTIKLDSYTKTPNVDIANVPKYKPGTYWVTQHIPNKDVIFVYVAGETVYNGIPAYELRLVPFEDTNKNVRLYLTKDHLKIVGAESDEGKLNWEIDFLNFPLFIGKKWKSTWKGHERPESPIESAKASLEVVGYEPFNYGNSPVKKAFVIKANIVTDKTSGEIKYYYVPSSGNFPGSDITFLYLTGFGTANNKELFNLIDYGVIALPFKDKNQNGIPDSLEEKIPELQVFQVSLNQQFQLKYNQIAEVKDYNNMRIRINGEKTCETPVLNPPANCKGLEVRVNQQSGAPIGTVIFDIKVGEKKDAFGATIYLISLEKGIATLRVAKKLAISEMYISTDAQKYMLNELIKMTAVISGDLELQNYNPKLTFIVKRPDAVVEKVNPTSGSGGCGVNNMGVGGCSLAYNADYTNTNVDGNYEISVEVVSGLEGVQLPILPVKSVSVMGPAKPTLPIDLSNYPNMFIKDNKFNGVFVVGDYASADDVIAVSDIMVSLQFTGTNEGAVTKIKKIEVGSTKLASEIKYPLNINLISVGLPCVNSVSEVLMGSPEKCTEGFTEGNGLIKLFNNNGYAQILVAGYSKEGTRKAAKVLANWKDYNLKGNEVIVTGTFDSPVVVFPTVPTNPPVYGDAYKIESPTNKLEISEDRIEGKSVETLRNIKNLIGKNELKALDSGQVVNNKGSSAYTQSLDLLGQSTETDKDTGYVIYTEDDNDITADFLYFKQGREIGTYTIEFTPSLISEFNSDLILTDFKNVDISLFGKKYTLVGGKSIGDGITLTLMGDGIKDTIFEKETKTYTINGKDYGVLLNFIDSDEAQFVVNGETTIKLKDGDTYKLSDGTAIGVTDVVYQDFTNGIHSATFYIGAEKLELRDTNIQDSLSSYTLKVNDKEIDDALVVIEGKKSDSLYEINKIKVIMKADDNFYVPAGKSLSDAIKQTSGQIAEPEVLFTQNWDIKYGGLSKEDSESIKLQPNGNIAYNLQFFDGNNNKVSVPIAKLIANEVMLGDVNGNFTNVEDAQIRKNDYFVLTDTSKPRGERKTFILQYKGADKITADSPMLKFKDLGSGNSIDIPYSAQSPLAILTLGEIEHKIYAIDEPSRDSILLNDFAIKVDLDGNGVIEQNKKVDVTSNFGMEISLDYATESIGNRVELRFITPDNKVESMNPSEIAVKIINSNNMLNLVKDTKLNLRTPYGQTNIAYGYTHYGAFITHSTPTNEPASLEISYPKNQRVPSVYVVANSVN